MSELQGIHKYFDERVPILQRSRELQRRSGRSESPGQNQRRVQRRQLPEGHGAGDGDVLFKTFYLISWIPLIGGVGTIGFLILLFAVPIMEIR